MCTVCPICKKDLFRRFEDHLIKCHGFDRSEAIELHSLCGKLIWINIDPNKAKCAQNQIDVILGKKFPKRNYSILDY